MKAFKKFFLIVSLLPFLGFICILGFNFSLDPDHIFSQGGDYPFIAKGQRYYKIAGILNNYDVKNIVVGASLMNNTLPSEVEAATGWRNVYLLTKDAADISRLAAITAYALRKRQIQNVVYALDPELFTQASSDQDARRGSSKSFMFLYDDNRLNDLRVFAQLPGRYLESWRDSRAQRKALAEGALQARTDKDILKASKDLNSAYMPDFYRDFNRPLFISSLSKADEAAARVSEDDRKTLAENYLRYLKPLVENNRNTQFHFLIPPGAFFSKRPGREVFCFATKFLVDNLSQYPNVEILAFANDAFNADLRLYKDYAHFHIEVARFIIQSLAHDDHRLTPKNIDAYLSEYSRTLEKYKIPPLWQAEYNGSMRGVYPLRSVYPKEGYITYHDAAKLVWGDRFSEALYNSIPRSPYLAEASYVDNDIKTWPPLDATRKMLKNVTIPRRAIRK